jgi:ferredoxin
MNPKTSRSRLVRSITAVGLASSLVFVAAACGDDEEDAAPATTAAPVEVRFRRSGRTLVWDGRDASLLDLADRHGVTVDSGCRSGNCGSCETAVASGTVRYAVTPDHEPAPGHCLLCVGTPGSALVLDA